MSEPQSITHWLQQLRGGQATAAQKLWEGYFHRLVGLARQKLRAIPRRAADEEDVALSAFDSFCRGAANQRFPRLQDRDDLWQVLLLVTERKTIDLIQHEARGKRDWRRLASAEKGSGESEFSLTDVVGREPDPAFAAQVAEQCQRLLGQLDDGLRSIALRKMEGYTNEEIAEKLSCSLATVERRLRLIRREWEESVTPGTE